MGDNRDTRSMIMLGGCMLLSLAFAVFAWRKWGPEVKQSEQFQLSVERILIPEAPRWVRRDIRAEVFGGGSLAGLNLTDPQLTEKVETAFRAHTWVAKVNRVRKHADGQVEVALEYRRPVALVEYLDQTGERMLYPVDRDGVVLPTRFLHDEEELIGEFLRISAGYSMPATDLEGTRWGDPRVEGAALIAGLLQNDWKQLGLYRIEATPGSGDQRSPQFELVTKASTRVVWGAMPGAEATGEPDATTKAGYLLQYVATHGPLDQRGPRTIDIRRLEPATAAVDR